MNDIPETTQFDVNLPKPRTHKVLIGVLAAVVVLGVIGVAAAVIANRTAQGTGEATATVMPADAMFYFSLNTHADQLPNFNVIAEAWKDSKEARQVVSGLELAVTQAGLDWDEDIAPWLGDRVAFGLIDLGGAEKAGETAVDTFGAYRSPGFIVALHTRDKAASDKAVANFRQMLEGNLKPNGYVTNTLADDAYRGIPLFYMTTESPYGWGDNVTTRTQENLAVATINDVVVMASRRADLQKAIDAALDGKSLVTSQNYQTVMNTLPAQNAGALYLDYSRFMPAYFDMMLGFSQSMSGAFDNIYDDIACRNDQGTLDEKCLQEQRDAAQREREEAQRKLEEQMQQMRDMMQSMGGLGAVMTYEGTGIRFDLAAQQDISKMPEAWRKFYETQQTPSPNRIFGSLPAGAIVAGNVMLNSAMWDFLFSPDYLNLILSGLPEAGRDQALAQLDQFQKLIGVDLKTDLLQLLDGEAAFVMLPHAQERSEFDFSLPFQFAAAFDSSDAAKATASLDKIFQGISALEDSLQWQSLSGLPYSVVMDSSGDPIFTYGVVDGRVVVGTSSDTLLAIDNAEQSPLANSETFKQAAGLLPDPRVGTFFMDFQPIWKMMPEADLSECQPCNYLQKFKWLSAGTEAPANGLVRGSLHIGVGQ
jgi:hypothetical protein